MKKYKNYFLILLLLIFTYCVSNNKNTENDEIKVSEDEINDSIVLVEDKIADIVYSVSTPSEIINTFKKFDLNYKADIIHNPSLFNNYITFKSQSINLGIYTADLAFCAYFEQFNETKTLITAIRNLSDMVRISAALSQNEITTIKQNIDNPDSLVHLAHSINTKIYQHLTTESRSNLLALIATGAFIESIYLIDKIAAGYDNNNPLFKVFAEHKYTFEVLRDFVDNCKKDANIKSILNDLQKINNIYNKITTSQGQDLNVVKKDNKLIIGASNELAFTEEIYNEFITMINKIRNKYINLE